MSGDGPDNQNIPEKPALRPELRVFNPDGMDVPAINSDAIQRRFQDHINTNDDYTPNQREALLARRKIVAALKKLRQGQKCNNGFDSLCRFVEGHLLGRDTSVVGHDSSTLTPESAEILESLIKWMLKLEKINSKNGGQVLYNNILDEINWIKCHSTALDDFISFKNSSQARDL